MIIDVDNYCRIAASKRFSTTLLLQDFFQVPIDLVYPLDVQSSLDHHLPTFLDYRNLLDSNSAASYIQKGTGVSSRIVIDVSLPAP